MAQVQQGMSTCHLRCSGVRCSAAPLPVAERVPAPHTRVIAHPHLASAPGPAVCGIFGYYNFQVGRTRKEILDCLLTGLKRLEYRGYDSAGVSVDLEPCPQNGYSTGVSIAAAAGV